MEGLSVTHARDESILKRPWCHQHHLERDQRIAHQRFDAIPRVPEIDTTSLPRALRSTCGLDGSARTTSSLVALTSMKPGSQWYFLPVGLFDVGNRVLRPQALFFGKEHSRDSSIHTRVHLEEWTALHQLRNHNKKRFQRLFVGSLTNKWGSMAAYYDTARLSHEPTPATHDCRGEMPVAADAQIRRPRTDPVDSTRTSTKRPGRDLNQSVLGIG